MASLFRAAAKVSLNPLLNQLPTTSPPILTIFALFPRFPFNNPTLLQLLRGIASGAVRSAVGGGCSERMAPARLSQFQHLLEEAEERALSAGNEPTPKITLGKEKNRINKDGEIAISSTKTRMQKGNIDNARREVTEIPKDMKTTVAIFWDLDNKPPVSFPPYEAAVRLRAVASSFGVVRYMVAYANSRSFSYVPPTVRDHRKEKSLLHKLETKGAIRPPDPYLCRVCGRKFYTNEKLVNHFREIHEREHTKRVNQIESARGKRRVNLVVKYSMKMEKYKRAVRDVLTPKVGYGLDDELKRAGFWVRTVSDDPQAADVALRNHMVDVMDRRTAECLVLVSDDSDFADVLKEAKMRCVRTVVVGDLKDGVLKRVADSGFSWRDVLMGKAKKEAPSVVSRWNDRDILKRLEWTYHPEIEKSLSDFDFVSNNEGEDDLESSSDEREPEHLRRDDHGAWWELGSSTDVASMRGPL